MEGVCRPLRIPFLKDCSRQAVIARCCGRGNFKLSSDFFFCLTTGGFGMWTSLLKKVEFMEALLTVRLGSREREKRLCNRAT